MNKPTLTFYHANAKGTGAAVKFELHPAHGEADGSIVLTVAPQGNIPDGSTFATFDWANPLTVKLGFDDLAKFLQVFRGERESINGNRGLSHYSPELGHTVQLAHKLDPVSGYALEVVEFTKNGTKEVKSRKAHFFFSSSESLGLALAIEQSMGLIAFGVPEVLQVNG